MTGHVKLIRGYLHEGDLAGFVIAYCPTQNRDCCHCFHLKRRWWRSVIDTRTWKEVRQHC